MDKNRKFGIKRAGAMQDLSCVNISYAKSFVLLLLLPVFHPPPGGCNKSGVQELELSSFYGTIN